MKYVALYPRVSTAEQAKEGYSIAEQIDRLKSFCHAMQWNDFKIYCDAGYSGGSVNRPALQEMISDIKAGKISKVVVYKLDRLSRSQKDTLNLIEDVFLKNDVDFVSISESFDTSTPFGRATVGILAVFAQLEREQIKERLTLGREARAKDGRWIGVGNAPVGYNYIDGNLVVNDFEAMQIKELFELYLQGKSPRIIARIFDEKGFRTRFGKWYEKRITTTLSNRLYAGFVSFDKKYYQGNHEPIIDAATFEKVQKEIEARRRSVVPAARQSTLLSGLVFCKKCGARYGLHTSGKYRYYSCYSRRKRDAAMIKDPNCKNRNYSVKELDDAVKSEIAKLTFDNNYIAEIKKDQRSGRGDDSEKIKIIEKKIENLNGQISRFLDLYGSGIFSAEELQSKVEPLKEQTEKLISELDGIKTFVPVMTESEAVEIISSFADAIENGTDEDIRPLIRALIEKIEIDDDKVVIHWNF